MENKEPYFSSVLKCLNEIPMKIDKSIWVLVGIGMATGLTVLLINILGLNK